MLDDDKILSILASELTHSVYTESDLAELFNPLSYYLGNPLGNEIEGRSQIVSTDIADAVEWIMPQIMKAFTQYNEVVHFDPTHAGDEQQAEVESEFVYDCLMKDNCGFVKIHTFVKDALLQNNGILKVYCEEYIDSSTTEFTGISEQAVVLLSQEHNTELLAASQNQDGSFDVRVSYNHTYRRIMVDCVPLEEFRLVSMHKSIDLTGARFTAHVTNKTKSELIEAGYDKDILDEITGYDINASAYRFELQNEANTQYDTADVDDSNALIKVSECYVYMDINGDGVAEFVKIVAAGDNTPTHILSKDELDSHPWISCTGILMSHKFKGLSIYDRLKAIQENKTALIRNINDNIYFRNNERLSCVNGQYNVNDVLLSKPGGIVRVAVQGAVAPIPTLPMGDEAYNMIRYFDEIRSGRVGVSPSGNAITENIGDRVGSQGIDQLMTASQELVGLIVRVIAETGIKPLCNKIRDLAYKHLDAVYDYQFRGQWMQVQPSAWPKKRTSTVRVGTGSGDIAAKTNAINQVMAIQEKLMSSPGQVLTNPVKVYRAIDDFCKFTGLNSANKYFIDPNSDEGKQFAQEVGQKSQQSEQEQKQLQLTMLENETKFAEAELGKVTVQMENVRLKAQLEDQKQMIQVQKDYATNKIADLSHQLAQIKTLLDSSAKDDQLQLQYDQLASNIALELTRIEASSNSDQNDNYKQNKGDA